MSFNVWVGKVVFNSFGIDKISKVLDITKYRETFVHDAIGKHLYYFYSPIQIKELKEWFIITHHTTPAAI